MIQAPHYLSLEELERGLDEEEESETEESDQEKELEEES